MKHLKLFFALFAMLALGVSNAWAEEVTFSGDDIRASFNYGNNYKEGTFTSDGFSIYCSSGYGNTAEQFRVAKSATLTINSTVGNITKVVITVTGTSYKLNDNNISWSSTTGTYSNAGGVQEITFTNSDANIARISKIAITYEPSSVGGGDPTPSTTYTIKWHTAVGTTTDVTLNEGATITKPATEPTMTGYEFMGWTEDCSVASDGSGFTAISNFGTATEDKDYYAVFAVATTTSGEGSSNYEKVTSNLTDWAGDYLIAYNNTTFADGRTGGTSGMGAQNKKVDLSSNISNNAIPASVGDQYNVTLEAVTGGYVLKTKDGNYNYQSSNANGLATTKTIATAASYAINVTFTSENDIKLALTGSAAGAVFRYNTQGYFRFYKNGGQSAVYLYKKTSGGGSTTTYDNYITTCSGSTPVENLTDAQFAWSAATAEATMGATNTFPTLTNTVPVSVTYESSNTSTATIVADGTITLVAPGTTTISAKFAGGEIGGTTYAAKTVTYALTVLKAPATPTSTVYVKVTSTAGITDGEYLIVYEDAEGNPKAPVAFDGSLETLDAERNNIDVTINSNTIAGNTDIDKATFTIDATAGTILSASGKYIGVTSYDNGLKQNAESSAYGAHSFEILEGNAIVKIAIADKGDMILNYNPSTNNGQRFRYYKGGSQKAIALYKKVDPSEILAPAFSVAAGSYYDAQSVEITCATAGVEIYYTLDGATPSSTSTKYTGAVAINETKTLKAIAIKGEYSSSVTEATYTILAPLATLQEIFDKATAVGSTATPVKVTMNNWVVTGATDKNVYVTDGTKGFIIYKNDGGHGFVAGDVLAGTVACKVQLYNGSAELTELTNTTEGLTVSTGGVVTPVVVNDVTTLGGVNTGSVIKITGTCESGNVVAGVKLYGTLYTFDNLTVGNKYNVTGVYLQYGDVEEILPRKQEDIEEVIDIPTATIAIANITMEVGEEKDIEATITPDAAQTKVQYAITEGSEYIDLDGTTITAVAAGTATITATIAEAVGEYYGTTKTFNVTVKPQNIAVLPFTFNGGKADIENTLGLSQTGLDDDYNSAPKLKFNGAGDNVIIHFDSQAGEFSFVLKQNGQNAGTFTVYESANGEDYTPIWSGGDLGGNGQSATIEPTLSATARYVKFEYTTKGANTNYGLGSISIAKPDNRAEAGLAWNPATVSLTVGDAFTAPTFSNPNSLAVSFESSNTELATVDNAGVISLVSGKTGTATITATFADGDATYKPAEVTCTIIVNHKSEDVVILAKCKDQYYALVAEYVERKNDVLQALPVEYVGGKIYNVETGDQASIIWKRVVVDGKTTFKNGDNYLSALNSAALNLATEACEWVFEGDMYKIEGSTRTILYYTSTGGFKNYLINNMSNDGVNGEYSSVAITVAPVFADGDAYHRTVTSGNYGTICLPFGSTNYSGATFYECVGSEPGKVYLGSVTALEAGVPYIFEASANELAVYSNGTTTDNAGNKNGLYGTFADNTTVPNNAYILYGGAFCTNNDETKPNKINAYRAYLDLSAVEGGKPNQMPGRRYIGMDVHGENGTTGLDNIMTTDAPVKVIENGQLIIIRDGVKYNVQGQKL